MKKKSFCIALFAMILLFSCTKKSSEMAGKITLVDSQNRTVTLPKPADRIIVMADSALCCVSQLQADDKIIALDSKSLSSKAMLLAFKKNPSLASLPDVGKSNNANYEAIVNLNPDVIFIKSSADDATAIQENTGIPVICVSYKNGIDFSIYRIIAKAIGKETKCEELLSVYQSKIDFLKNFADSIPDEEKIPTYIAVANSKGLLTKTLVDLQGLSLAGGKNVASSVTKFNEWGECEVSKESILNWNPQVVFVDRSKKAKPITKEDFKSDRDFSEVLAVQSDKIFDTFYFYSAPKDYALLIAEGFYNANILYPEKMDKITADKNIGEILGIAYNVQNYEDELYN